MPSRSNGLAAEVQAVRTLALVGAAASGKTSLAEALLFKAGAIGACGSIERGSTVSDHDPLERRMLHSLNASVLHLTHAATRIHLIDTPGGPDFLGQSLPALEAVETVAVVINAATGIEPMAVRMMDYAASRHLARMIVVTKIDSQGVSLAGLLADIQATFGRECLPLNLPDGVNRQVIDCFFNRFGRSDFGPVEASHRALVEQVVEVDAAFVDRYLEEGDVDPSELHAPLEQALREGHLIPVCFTSSRSGAGVAELLDVIVKLLPDPTEGNPPEFIVGEGAQAQPMQARPDPSLHVLAHVFKVTIDPYVGKMGIFRVHQGTLTRDSQLYIGDGRKPFKVGHLFMLQGKDHVEVSRALPGDIVAVAKVDEIHFDAVLHDAAEDSHVHLAPLPFPVPVYGLAIEPKRHGDEQRAWEILGKLAAEDPCLRIEHVAATNETVLYGLGELHLRIALERLREVYHFEVLTRPPRIAYRETVTAPAEGHHRHKKQSGGAGQFAEVFLRIEPLARGAGFEFADEVRGGAIPNQFIPAVEKGVREVLAYGAIAGYPVVDVRVVVYDGKHHSVDSKDIAFATAGRKAFMAAIREARPAVLEPIVQIEIAVPEHSVGDVTSDLSSRRGLVTGTTGQGGGTVAIGGQVPEVELANYQSRLHAMTAGQGRYTIALSHYEAVPPAVQKTLMGEYRGHEED
ncbi:elongation factor G [Variovorax sp. EBFNA2]|uniref:elongation factor G n=1 Tax=Variovorax sp. EBFNA2 TaxID=3342097 RepID=UPI0029C05E43|nr:elongation factor G [Variovorax boronicumulans]WPG35734.1 elongation factor G [Variovorax boronicumulans]